MAKFLVTYKIEEISYESEEVEEEDATSVLDNARKKAKELTNEHSKESQKISFSLVSIKQLNGE